MRLRAVAPALLLSGCAYYNGMYNAERLAGSAERAERDQRTLEANGLWGQVATKADSVIARHPDSKWADDAWMLRGIALERLGQCEPAVRSLAPSVAGEADAELIEKATLSLARCQLALGRLGAAEAAYARVVDSSDPARRREARLGRGRALRAAGRYAEAVELLGEVPGRVARAELAAALGGAGRTAEAIALADSLAASQDTTLPWQSIVNGIATTDPIAASRLAERLSTMGSPTPDQRARWLLDDARRLADVDSARARQRLEEVARVGGDGPAGGEARLALIRRELAAVTHPAELQGPVDRLTQLGKSAAPAATVAAQLAGMAGRIRTVADSVPAGAPEGELQLFLAAEIARDSLAAPALAASLFRRVVDEWPESPYAPKALLAWHHLEPGRLDSIRVLLDSVYADSPYLARIRGEDPPGYRVLEDSLGAFATAHAAAFRPPPPATPRGNRPADNGPRGRGRSSRSGPPSLEP